MSPVKLPLIGRGAPVVETDRWHYGKLGVCKEGKTHGKGFVVRFSRKRTAKALSCVFPENARQRVHGSNLHGKSCLPCVLYYTHGKKSLSCVKCSARQKKVVDGAPPNGRLTTFAVRLKKTHGKH
jgi:hypothetical protein